MMQINKMFGNSSEFTTTVRDGEIVEQNLILDTTDAQITVKLDRNFLTAKDLRQMANDIDAAVNDNQIKMAGSEDIEPIRRKFLDFAAKHAVFKGCDTMSHLNVALEFVLSLQSLTMYSENISNGYVDEECIEE